MAKGRAPVAQQKERVSTKDQAVGAIPTGGTSLPRLGIPQALATSLR